MNTVETARDAMLRRPTTHAADLTVGEAQAVFAQSPKTHLLLLVQEGSLVAALTRDDVAGRSDTGALAAPLGALEGRTVPPDVPVTPLREAMAGTGMRRVAVVDAGMRLLGLLCLKRTLDGFCTDEGVAAMRAARGGSYDLPPSEAQSPRL